MNALVATSAVLGCLTGGISMTVATGSMTNIAEGITSPMYSTSGGTTAVPSWTIYPQLRLEELPKIQDDVDAQKLAAHMAKLSIDIPALIAHVMKKAAPTTRKRILEDLRKLNNDL